MFFSFHRLFFLILFTQSFCLATAGGSNKEIQYNNNGVLDGVEEFYYELGQLFLNISLHLRNGINFKGQIDADFLIDSTSGWIDLPSQPVARGSGTNVPAFIVFRNNLYSYTFEPTALNELFYTIHIPHSYDKQNDLGLYFHVHTSTNNAAPTGNFVIFFEYSAALSDGTFSATTTVSKTASFTSQYEHNIVEIDTPVLGGGAIEIDSLVLVRVYRNGGVGDDTFTDNVFILQIDTHIQINKLASKYRNKLTTGSFYV